MVGSLFGNAFFGVLINYNIYIYFMILFALLEPVLCDVLDTTTVVFLFVEDTIDNIYIIIQYIHIYI